MTETRYQRIAREQSERQAARKLRILREHGQRKPRRKAPRYESDEPRSPSLDPDGRWRDNLGESPDW